MTQHNIVRAVRMWIFAAAAAVPLRLHMAVAQPSVATPLRDSVVTSLRLTDDSVSHLVDDAVSANLFGASASDDGVAGRNAPALSSAASPVLTAGQRMRFSAIIGPPWRAVLERDGSQAAPVVVEAGDTLLTFRILRISADTVVLKKGRTISRRIVAESWLP